MIPQDQDAMGAQVAADGFAFLYFSDTFESVIADPVIELHALLRDEHESPLERRNSRTGDAVQMHGRIEIRSGLQDRTMDGVATRIDVVFEAQGRPAYRYFHQIRCR